MDIQNIFVMLMLWRIVWPYGRLFGNGFEEVCQICIGPYCTFQNYKMYYFELQHIFVCTANLQIICEKYIYIFAIMKLCQIVWPWIWAEEVCTNQKLATEHEAQPIRELQFIIYFFLFMELYLSDSLNYISLSWFF